MTGSRADLGFAASAQQVFTFLESDYGFKCTEANVTYLRYEHGDVFVAIHHGRTSFEVGLQIGFHDQGLDSGFGLGTLIALNDRKKGMAFRYSVAHTASDVVMRLTELAQLLRQYGDTALRGDRSAFQAMRKLVDEYWASRSATKTKEQAATAFRCKDYAKAATLYNSVRQYLSDVEKRKLSIAMKQLQQSEKRGRGK